MDIKLADLNLSWVLLIGSLSLCWVISNALISYHETRQREQCVFQIRKILEKWQLVSIALLSPEEFLKQLEDRNLALSAYPDVVLMVRLARNQVSGCLVCSTFLVILIFLLEAGIFSGLLPAQARSASAWLAIFSGLVSAACIAYMCFIGHRCELSAAFKELARARRLGPPPN